MYHSIKSTEDIQYFLDKTNGLHDGYIIGVQYRNNGISKEARGHSFDPAQTKLILQILVTSIWDTVVEIEFEHLSEWQIRDDQWDIMDTSIVFDDYGRIVWLDDTFTNMDEVKNGSYAIAESMRWRIVE